MKTALYVAAAAILVAAASRPAFAQGRGGFTGPSVSVRPANQPVPRTLALNLLGWRAGVRSDAFGPISFLDAAAKVDAASMAFIEGVSENLDYNLSSADVDKAKARLNELRLRMPVYSVNTLPGDAAARRKLFEFAKALGAEMIVCSADTSALIDLDNLAGEFSINVALTTPVSLEHLSAHMGRYIGPATRPSDLRKLNGRQLMVDLRGAKAPGPLLLELSRLQPPNRPVDYPPPPGHDGGGHKAEVKPLFFSVDPTRAAAEFDTAVPPAIRYRVDALALLTPSSTPEKVPADQKTRIDSAIPRQAPAKPKKQRKLLVLDLALNGAEYHGSTPLGNLSLQLMSKYTGAFTPVFSNDLNNLKYPQIKKFDGVFLNQIQGDVFADHDAIDGLTRYVHEGGGVAGLHAATWASQNVPEFGEMMGGTSGAHKYNGEWGALRVDDPDSPIVRQFGGKPFEFFDEFYHFIPAGPYSREKLHVLLSMDPARKDLPGNQYTNRPDNDYGMVWIRSYGKGRVFNVALGHRPEFYEVPNMQQMLLAGIQFILGDLEADTTPGPSLAPKK